MGVGDRSRARLGAVVATVTLTVGLCSLAGLAAARPAAAWTSGMCPDGNGVTVVVDFQDLGGGVVTRCAEVSAGATGIDALKKAGFTVTGTARYGLAFVCRLDSRPGPEEVLQIPGNDSYRENCQDTPKGAFWSYWSASNGGSWTSQSFGALSRQVVIGGFEGWSFSTGKSANVNPVPRQVPSRPDVPTGGIPVQGGADAGAAGGPQGRSGGQAGAKEGGSKAGPGGASNSGSDVQPGDGGGGDPAIPAAEAPEAIPEESNQPPESDDGDITTSPTKAVIAGESQTPGRGGGIPLSTALGIGAVVMVGSAAVTTVVFRRRTAAKRPGF